MSHKRLLYLTGNRLTAYSLSRSGIEADASFERNDAGFAAFATYVHGTHHLYYAVVDVVEEDYHLDSIPYLGRKDRQQVLARKLAQRYRDTSLTLSLSLGQEKGERRNERVLYASFSNTQQIQPWLSALAQSESRLAGVYSTALLAPAVVKRAGIKAARCLLVSVQQSGMRQSYVEDGKIRFSRVGRLNLEDTATVAAACATESARLQQYLFTMRVLPEANTPIDVMVLAADKYQAALAQTCRSTELLAYHLVNADNQCRSVGLKSFPSDAPCDALFLQSAATSAPREQFAQEQHRRQYIVWRIGRGLYAAGAAVFALGLLTAAAQLIGAYNLRGKMQSDEAQFAAINAEYTRITATFPKLPTTTENLKSTITQFKTLETQAVTPVYLYSEISKVMADFQQVDLERVEWRVDKLPKDTGAKGAALRAASREAETERTPSAAAAGAAEGAAAVDALYEIATITARVVGARRSDLRAITSMTSQFIDALRKSPRLEVLNIRMPFDLGLENRLSGDIGSERTIAEDARFNVTIARKLGK